MCEIMDAGAAAPEGGPHGRSSAVDVSVVMALLFGHADGEERVAGDPGVGGAPARHRQRPDRVGRPDSETLGGIRYEAWREGFSGRKLSVLTPTAAMSAGVATLLRALLWVPSPCRAPGENP
jgi:hypothetical protein